MKSAAEKMGKGQFLKQLEPPTAQKKKKKKNCFLSFAVFTLR